MFRDDRAGESAGIILPERVRSISNIKVAEMRFTCGILLCLGLVAPGWCDDAKSAGSSESKTTVETNAEKTKSTESKPSGEASKPEGKVESKVKSNSGKMRSEGSKKPGMGGGERARLTKAEREKSALAFVEKHHPELAGLLTWLKEHKSADYQRAINEIVQTSVRLERIKEKQPDRYELELQVWQAGSRARLTAATAAITDDFSPTFFKDSLIKDLRQQEEGRLKLLEMDQHDLKERLEKVEQSLTTRRADLEKKVDGDAAKLLQSAEAQRKKAEQLKTQASANNKKKDVEQKSEGAEEKK